MKKLLSGKSFVILFTTLFCAVSNLKVYSQNKTNPHLKGYSENNYLEYAEYFDSLHFLRKATIKSLTHSYECYAVFKIDSSVGIKEFEFIEIPEAPLPEIAKTYIKALFLSTNEKWQQEIIEKKRTLSDGLLFSISLLKSDQTPNERFEDIGKTFEFGLMALPKVIRVKGYDLSNEKIITLSY